MCTWGYKMTLTYGDGKVEIGRIESILDALLKSESIQDFSRSIVHSEITDSSVQGCHFYSLDSESHLKPVSGYGRTYLDTEIALSAWDDDPIAECIRKKEFEFQNPSQDTEKGLLAIPLLKDSIPVGALALVVDGKNKNLPIHETLIPVLMKIGAYCLTAFAGSSGNSVGNKSNSFRESNGEDLTSRQIKILDLMADGMVNVEIARDLMLSESTIRQETVRIYRALGVPNRIEAAKKGRTLGLIKRPPPPA
jgi:DNA-binding CsgD family transcriptional regulator